MEAAEKRRKRIKLGAISLLIIIFAIIVCTIAIPRGERDTQEAMPPETVVTSPEPENVPDTLALSLGESAFNDNLAVTVSDVSLARRYPWRSGSGSQFYDDADPGRLFVIADVLIENIGSSSELVGTTDISGQDQDRFAYDTELYLGEDRLSFTSLLPSQRHRGKVLFDIPDSTTRFTIYYDFGNIFSGSNLASWSFTIGATGS